MLTLCRRSSIFYHVRPQCPVRASNGTWKKTSTKSTFNAGRYSLNSKPRGFQMECVGFQRKLDAFFARCPCKGHWRSIYDIAIFSLDVITNNVSVYSPPQLLRNLGWLQQLEERAPSLKSVEYLWNILIPYELLTKAENDLTCTSYATGKKVSALFQTYSRASYGL